MSVQGTSIAAGVAQTTLASQQTARRQDREASRVRDDSRRVRERFESHLQSLEEGDESKAADRVQIDGQLPEHGGSPPGGGRRPGREQAAGDLEPGSPNSADAGNEAATAYADATGGTSNAVDGGQALYRHLDVEA